MLAIAKRAHDSRASAEADAHKVMEALLDVFKSFASHTMDADERGRFADELKERVPDLVKAYAVVSDAATAMDRFLQLDQDRITHLFRYFASYDEQFTNEKDKVFVDITEAGLREYVRQNASKWYAELLKTKRPSRFELPAISNRPNKIVTGTMDRVQNDAQVLAALDYINETLFPKSCRLLLITASPYVYAAVEKRVWNSYYNLNQRKTFGELFLRHPQWLLSHPDFFQTAADAGEKLSTGGPELKVDDWVELLDPAGQNTVVKEAKNLRNRDLRKIPEEWQSFLLLFAGKRFGAKFAKSLDRNNRSIPEDLLNDLLSIFQSGDWTAEKLERLLKKPVTDSLSKLFFSSTLVGLLEAASLVPSKRRRMPALRFGRPYEIFNRYYRMVQEIAFKGAEQPLAENPIRELNKLMDEGPDNELYHRHVIHAAAFAAAEEWGAVLTLCDLAIEIADGVMGSVEKEEHLSAVRGREAAYMAAIASRRSANKIEELAIARGYLAEAIRRDEKTHLHLDVRFRSEDLAIKTRSVFFTYFLHGEQDNALDVARQIVERLSELLLELEATTSLYLGELEDEQIEKDIRDWVSRQSYANLFALLLIAFDMGRPGDFKSYERTLDKFVEVLGIEDADPTYRADRIKDRNGDVYSWIVCQTSRIATHRVQPERLAVVRVELSKQLELLDRKVSDRNRRVMPYDAARTELFRRIAGVDPKTSTPAMRT